MNKIAERKIGVAGYLMDSISVPPARLYGMEFCLLMSWSFYHDLHSESITKLKLFDLTLSVNYHEFTVGQKVVRFVSMA